MSTNSLIWQKANGRFAMLAFWAIIGVYTHTLNTSHNAFWSYQLCRGVECY